MKISYLYNSKNIHTSILKNVFPSIDGIKIYSLTKDNLLLYKIFNCNVSLLENEFIDLEQDIKLKDIFNDKNKIQ